MNALISKNDVILQLRKEVLSIQGLRKPLNEHVSDTGLGQIEKSFPDCTFPIGVVHEFISKQPEDATATNGFISALLGNLVQQSGYIVWAGIRRTLFPPVLKTFGIDPDRIIFIDLIRQKEALWTIEEALKCNAVCAVIGELCELDFTQSRRLQLAVENSHVTGFIHRHNPRTENVTACVTRWKVRPVASITEEGMPGVGFPRWDVQLQKVRNGTPGRWQLEWSPNGFRHIAKPTISLPSISILKHA